MTHICFGHFHVLLYPVILQLYSSVSGSNNGLYVSNGTDILYLGEDTDATTGLIPQPSSIYHKENGRILGLALDIAANVIFWSDVSKHHLGIYKAALNNGSQLQDSKQVVSSDLVEVNGLAADWESKHVYWTDAKKRTIEVCEYDGTNRRVLGITGLLAPRGIYSDPVSGYIFWNDQISRTINRARPDGTEQRVLVSKDVILPNQLIVHRSELFWVDSNDKDVWRCNIDGSMREKLGSVSRLTLGSNIFGIAINADGKIYISAWERGQIVAFTVEDQNQISLKSVVPYSIGTSLFSMAFYRKRNIQPSASNPCDPSRHKYGCTHLCLPTGAQSARCSCPSYGGLTLNVDGKTCTVPKEVLLFALAGSGEVAYIDTGSPGVPDRYLVGRSLRPVAVAYDSVDQMVYWSDVHEKRIHRAKLDGSGHSIFLSMKDGIGVVDGLTIDVKNRMLYYANIGYVMTDGVPYGWHKIEAISLNGGPVRTIVHNAEKPRALFIDSVLEVLYYTDWGAEAKVMRTNLDGSKPYVLQRDLDNPNGIAVMGGNVFAIDSHYKSRQAGNTRYPRRNASIAIMNTGNTENNWQEFEMSFLRTPFGLAALMTKNPQSQKFFITDWETGSITSLSYVRNDWQNPETILQGLETPMGIFHSYVSTSFAGHSLCESSLMNCQDVCFPTWQNSKTCSCSSYAGQVLEDDSSSCAVPKALLLFADMSSIKLIGYNTKDRSVYNMVTGNEHLDNYVALAYDPREQGVYYSDVSGRGSRGIYFQKLDGTAKRTVYQGNVVIDGLAIDPVKKQLYWSDYLTSEIVTMAASGDLATKQTLARALSLPRAVEIDTANGYLYWTEWGEHPRVARMALNNPQNVEPLVTRDVKQPNGLGLDVSRGKMYIGDAHYKTIKECNLDGSECNDLPYVTGVPEHIFDVVKHGDALFYSDWIRGTVTEINMKTGKVAHVASKLMRPTSIVVNLTTKKVCPSDHKCQSACMPVPGGYQCLCDVGHVLQDEYTCSSVHQWKPAVAQQCSTPCGTNAACAEQTGGSTVVYQCQCRAGYVLRSVNGESTCVECETNTYKEYIGDDGRCDNCPESASHTPPGSTQCVCVNGSYWHSAEAQCVEGDKEGVCSDIKSARFTCSHDCKSDNNCPGAQKCCSLMRGCNEQQCVDAAHPNGVCTVNGTLYNVGDKITSNKCLDCICSLTHKGLDAHIHCVPVICKILLCKEEDQVSLPGKCCKSCAQTIRLAKNITIDNCPAKKTLILELDHDSMYAKDLTNIQIVDQTGFDRSVNVSKMPPGVFYQWTAEIIDVTWSAAAQQPSGDWEVAICSYSIKVKDLIPPMLTCPDDIVIYSPQNQTRVRWLPPWSTDNVGLAPGYPKVIKGQKWASLFSTGEHTVTYVSRDLSHNEKQCSFKVIVHELLSAKCKVVSPHHGEFSCVDAGKGIVACQLYCNTSSGYVMNAAYNSTYQYECINGQWNPELSKSYLVDTCVEITNKMIMVKQKFLYPECFPGLAVAEAEIDLIDRIKRRIKTLSASENMDVGVKLLNQCHQPHTMTITLGLSGLYQLEKDRVITEKQLKQSMHAIMLSVMAGDLALVRALILGTHFYVKPNSNVLELSDIIVANVNTNQGCLESQSVTDGCMTCPEGMYLNGKAMCAACTQNTFTDLVNQKECRLCDHNMVSPEASYTSLLCSSCLQDNCGATLELTEKAGPSVMILAIIVASTVIVLIVIIIVMVFVIRRLRRPRSSQSSKSQGISFTNPVFGEVTINQDPTGNSVNNNDKSKEKTRDKGSIRSTGSSSSAMARAYPDMPEKEVEVVLENY